MMLPCTYHEREPLMTPSFNPGFRFSAGDFVMLLAAVGFAWWIHDRGPWLVHVVAFVVLNFFLFCNVFRVARPAELAWSVVFVVLAGVRLRTGALTWSTIYLISSVLAAIIIAMEMRKPSYHGLGWSRINPGLKDWWLSKHPEQEPATASATHP